MTPISTGQRPATLLKLRTETPVTPNNSQTGPVSSSSSTVGVTGTELIDTQIDGQCTGSGTDDPVSGVSNQFGDAGIQANLRKVRIQAQTTVSDIRALRSSSGSRFGMSLGSSSSSSSSSSSTSTASKKFDGVILGTTHGSTDTRDSEIEFVEKAIVELEREHIRQFTPTFDHNFPDLDLDGSIGALMSKRHPDTWWELDRTISGKSGAMVLTVTPKSDDEPTAELQTARYVIKESGFTKTMIADRGKEILKRIKLGTRMTYAERIRLGIKPGQRTDKVTKEGVRELLIDRPDRMFNQKFPHCSAAQREVMAKDIGDYFGCGVPNVETMCCAAGHYTMHEFVEGSTELGRYRDDTGFDVASVQSMAVLDMVLLNHDRNAFNVLVSPSKSGGKPRTVPIDHTQILQHEKREINPDSMVEPVWLKFAESAEPLPKELRDKIMDFNIESILKAAHAKGSNLHIGKVEIEMIKFNVACLQKAISAKADSSLRELGEDFFEQDASLLEGRSDESGDFPGGDTFPADDNPFLDQPVLGKRTQTDSDMDSTF